MTSHFLEQWALAEPSGTEVPSIERYQFHNTIYETGELVCDGNGDKM